jgi:hypothetical protein
VLPLPDQIRQHDRKRDHAPGGKPRARKEFAQWGRDEADRESGDVEQHHILALERYADGNADRDPQPRVRTAGDAHEPERDERPREQADFVRRDLAPETCEHARKQEDQRREGLREKAAAEFGYEQTRGEDACGSK